MSIEEMAAYIKVDSLGFVSIDGLYRAVGEAGRNAGAPQFCDACFTGDYPTRLTDGERRAAIDAIEQQERRRVREAGEAMPLALVAAKR